MSSLPWEQHRIKSMRNKNNKFLPFLYLLPTAILLIVFLVVPILYTFYLSFFDWNLIAPTKEFVGMRNYLEVFTDAVNQKVILNTLIYIVFLVVLNFVFPYFISQVETLEKNFDSWNIFCRLVIISSSFAFSGINFI